MGVTAAVAGTVAEAVCENKAPWSPPEKGGSRGVGFCPSLTLLVKMKGHVGGGSGSDILRVSGARLKPSLACMSLLLIHSNSICAG